MAGAGTKPVVQTLAEAHMWPLARDRGGRVVQTMAEAPTSLASLATCSVS